MVNKDNVVSGQAAKEAKGAAKREADIGLIGLAVMGQNLALNMNDKGFKVAVYNRSDNRTQQFIKGPATGTGIIATTSIVDFVATLKRPRKIFMAIKAGNPVDASIEQLSPYLEPGDILLDGGNSRFTDTNRRYLELGRRGIRFIGCGVSGGEEGARHGPSIMPGGDETAWPAVKPILQSIAAQFDGEPCCQWIGNEGAGHYVKMVHNGIEYGDMQLIAEAYHLMRKGLGLSVDEIQQVFTQWNTGVLDSYLIGITADILAHKDKDGAPLLDSILDVAGQKGTGKWASINALEMGMPLTLIGEAVFARFLSSLKKQRINAERVFSDLLGMVGVQENEQAEFNGDRQAILDDIHDALYAAKIISYTQGYMLMSKASDEYGWDLNYGNIAATWRGGCIIRSVFLSDIKSAFESNPNLENLLLDEFFIRAIKKAEPGWRRAVTTGIAQAIPLPAMSAALSFFDGYKSGQLPANLLQAQRDYFGAHTYERVDCPRGEFFHTHWISDGGDTVSTNYEG